MEARDNSFDLDMIHSKPTPTQTPIPIPKPYSMHRQYSMQQPAPPPQHQLQSHFQSHSQSRHPAANQLPRQRATSEHWLSSSSFSLSAQGTRPAREHFPLRHQPLSYPQSRPHSSSAFSRPAAAYSHHHQQHSQSATTSFATPPTRHRSPRPDYEWSASTAQAKIDAVTHAIRNKIIVEEDEEDILSTDRFY